jgi:hypothetical protein
VYYCIFKRCIGQEIKRTKTATLINSCCAAFFCLQRWVRARALMRVLVGAHAEARGHARVHRCSCNLLRRCAGGARAQAWERARARWRWVCARACGRAGVRARGRAGVCTGARAPGSAGARVPNCTRVCERARATQVAVYIRDFGRLVLQIFRHPRLRRTLTDLNDHSDELHFTKTPLTWQQIA